MQLRVNTQYLLSQLTGDKCALEVNTGSSKSPLHYLAVVLQIRNQVRVQWVDYTTCEIQRF